jgi:hypothetical protein
MTKQRLEELCKAYAEAYKQLYDNPTETTDVIISYFAMYHDNDMKKDPEYKAAIQELAKYRGDIFTSDRECAAAYLAVSVLERRPIF